MALLDYFMWGSVWWEFVLADRGLQTGFFDCSGVCRYRAGNVIHDSKLGVKLPADAGCSRGILQILLTIKKKKDILKEIINCMRLRKNTERNDKLQ